jgi:Holin of 3TMs, for gene-transfer release
MLPALLAQIGLPVLIKTVTGALEKLSSPAAQSAAAVLKQVTINPEETIEANRHIERMTEFESEEYKTAISEVNASLRAEITSNDPYVRRMRPTFGYLVAVAWACQMLAIAFVIVETPEKAATVTASLSNLDTIWTVGLSVLGIYVYKRSQEKRGK